MDINDQKFSEGFCVNVGNPHIIFLNKDYMKHDLRVIGPKIENHDLFPEKTNVTFANVIDKKNIKVNVWERGAGLTKLVAQLLVQLLLLLFLKISLKEKYKLLLIKGL